MIADAREDSLAAAKLYESLVQIVARYRGVGTTAEKESNGVDGEIPAETLRCLPEDVVGEDGVLHRSMMRFFLTWLIGMICSRVFLRRLSFNWLLQRLSTKSSLPVQGIEIQVMVHCHNDASQPPYH
jgi:hypothetical protein